MTAISSRIDPNTAALLALGIVLAAVAAFNYADGVYGGAIVAAIGSLVTITLALLTD